MNSVTIFRNDYLDLKAKADRLEAAERELTAMAARCAELAEALGKIEKMGAEGLQASNERHSEDRFSEIEDIAVDALRAPLPARAAAMGAVVEAVGKISSRHPIPHDPCGLMLGFDSRTHRDKFCDACDALAKLDGAT